MLKAYYTSPQYLQGAVSVAPWDWEGSLKMSVPPRNATVLKVDDNASFVNSKPRPVEERTDFASWSFYFVLEEILTPLLGLETLEDAGRSFAYFFSMDAQNVPGDAITAGTLLRNSLVCDFEAVTFCHKKDVASRKNLVVSFIIAYVVYVAVSALMDAMLITRIISPLWKNAMLLIVVPWIGFQLAYGVGPTCFPMLPTCLLQDIVLQLQMTVPIQVVWPNALQRYPGCLGNNNASNASSLSAWERQRCLLPCRGPPFYFESWESSLSWTMCSLLGHGKCVNMTKMLVPSFVTNVDTLERMLTNYSAVIAESYSNVNATSAMDMWHAHQFCYFMTLGQAVPYFLLVVILAMCVVQLVKMPFALVAAAVQFVWQAIAFTHSAD